MSFWEHLEELRRRIIISAIAIAVFTVLSLSFSKPIEKVIKFPLETSMNTLIANAIDVTTGSEGSILGFLALTLRAGNSTIDATLMKVGPLEGIMAYLKLGITTGILLGTADNHLPCLGIRLSGVERKRTAIRYPSLFNHRRIFHPRCHFCLLYCHTRRTTILRTTASRATQHLGSGKIY